MARIKNTPPATQSRSVRAQVPIITHKALKKRQRQIEETTEERPQLVDVVALVLNEWAQNQPQS